MGLFDRLKGITEPVDAEFRIVACSNNNGRAMYENCAMDGVVSGPGIDPVPVHHTSMLTPTAKWPYSGVVLPVTVDREHPERLKINWDAVPNSRDVARALAVQQAQQMGAAGATVSPTSETQVVGAPGRPVPGMPGGGLTPAESAQAAAGAGTAIGLQATVATVLAANEVPVPAGVTGAAPGGVWDLTLEVTATPGYTTVLRINFSSPEKRQQIAAAGRQLPVLADPSRHDRIAIDTTRL